LQWNRDLLRSVYTIRTQENLTPGKGRGQGTVALPELRRGRVALCFATLLARSTGTPVPHVDFASLAQAQAVAQGQLAYYRALEGQGHIRVVTGRAAVERHRAGGSAWDAAAEPPVEAHPLDTPPPGFVISMEGADPIAGPQQLQEWWDAGLRLLGLTHYGPG